METIDLDIEESNELLFKVKIEGIEPAPAKVRLVCEAGDVSYMFKGHATSDDVVQFMLPSLSGKLKEGVYSSRVEVLIENRYFAPVEFNINFKKAVKVVAEAVQVAHRAPKPQVSVTAVPVVVPVVKKQVAVPVAPPKRPVTAPVSPRMTLKERHTRVIDDVDEEGENLLRELAQSFARSKK